MKNAAGPDPRRSMSFLATGRRIVRPVAPRFSPWEPAGRRGESKNTAARPARRAFPDVSPAHDPHEESDADFTRSTLPCQALSCPPDGPFSSLGVARLA